LKKLENWGVPYALRIRKSNDYRCPQCNWDSYSSEGFLTFGKHTVGFCKEQPGVPKDTRCGIVIVKCPECSENFWIHITEVLCEALEEKCPLWPKGPT
jgi:predicted RNA-binding Zn-ribbon protein involved in translation (DUF1610 family)